MSATAGSTCESAVGTLGFGGFLGRSARDGLGARTGRFVELVDGVRHRRRRLLLGRRRGRHLLTRRFRGGRLIAGGTGGKPGSHTRSADCRTGRRTALQLRAEYQCLVRGIQGQRAGPYRTYHQGQEVTGRLALAQNDRDRLHISESGLDQVRT